MAPTGIDFEDPVEMLLFLDDDLLEGHYSLHKWQMQIMKDFARESTADAPYQAVARAANGSGKDKYLIAPCAVWLCMKYPESTAVITSASGTQLDRQTDTYIRKLATSANAKINSDLWTINYRHYACNLPQPEGGSLQSTMELFVTDEAGRAEGWHPKTYNSQLAIFTSEAKSIPEEIFHALARCTGFTKRLDVSSPGLPMGHFFNRCTSGNWLKYHITAYDCPHLSKAYIEQCKIDYGGENSALFKSMVLAEFGTTDDMVVIPYHKVWHCIYNNGIGWIKEKVNHAGLDLSAGGDETVLVVRNGNKVIAVVGFRFDDTARTVNFLEEQFKKYGLNGPTSLIYGDAGGLGKPILDQLRSRGWHNIRYVLNQGKPADQRVYFNRGAELWFKFARYVENGEIILPDDERLKRQLSTRYYKQTEGNKLQLESKLQARAKGHPSPDRADATILAFTNYKSIEDRITVVEEKLPMKPKEAKKPEPDFTLQGYVKRNNAPPEEFQRQKAPTDTAMIREEIAEYNRKRIQEQTTIVTIK